MRPLPIAPPNTASPVKAQRTIVSSAGMMYWPFIARMTMQPTRYRNAMIGTSFSQTRAMSWTLPNTTSATSTTTIAPSSHDGTSGTVAWMMLTMALDCTAEPVPSAATAANRANAPAPSIAHQGQLPSLRS